MSLQIPFISVPLKRTDDVDWVNPLKRYIAQVYREHPDSYNDEAWSLQRLRQDAKTAGMDVNGRDLMYRYYGQLELLDLRFPVDEKHVKMLFNWYDAFDEKPTAQYSLAFEKASMIFNIGATLSSVASAKDRAESEGRKVAFNFLQAAAGMFQYINDNFLHAPSKDLNRDTLQMLVKLMFSQAQECFIQSSISEQKIGLTAKLASHAAWVYGNIVDDMQGLVDQDVSINKAWVVTCKTKHKYYQSISQQYRAQGCESDAAYGERVARLASAVSLAKEATKQSSSLASLVSGSNAAGTLPEDSGSSLHSACQDLVKTCSEEHAKAVRENDLIYHDPVPQESVLKPIDRLNAVKAVPISDIYGQGEATRIIGADIFARLIPLSVHESASVYSEEMAKMLRQESELCDVSDAELKTTLEYMHLPSALNKFKYRNETSTTADLLTPPDEVCRMADSISKEESIPQQSLQDLFRTVSALKGEARQQLDRIEGQLEQEVRDGERMHSLYGDQQGFQSSTPSIAESFLRETRDHRSALNNAGRSDDRLSQRFESVTQDIDFLKLGSAHDDFSAAFTVLVRGSRASQERNSLLDVDDGDDLDSKVHQVDVIVDKLRKIERERKETMEDLRERTKSDDISQALLLNKSGNDELRIFAAELEKYRAHRQRLGATILRQQESIKELSEAFKTLMSHPEARRIHAEDENADKNLRNTLKQLKKTNDEYAEIKSAIRQGVSFYTQMKGPLSTLSQRVDRFVQDRGRERSNVELRVQAQRGSLMDSAPTWSSHTSPAPMTPSAPSAPALSDIQQHTAALSLHLAAFSENGSHLLYNQNDQHNISPVTRSVNPTSAQTEGQATPESGAAPLGLLSQPFTPHQGTPNADPQGK